MEQDRIARDFGLIDCFHNNYRVYIPSIYDQTSGMKWKRVAECSICHKRVQVPENGVKKEIYIYDW